MPRTFRIPALAIFMTLFTFSQCAFAAVMEKEIEAEGKAVGHTLRSKDEAVNRALRNAVEQGVGVLVDSETMVQNFELLDDKIYSETKGYVKSYEVISDNEGEDGIYRVRVKAVVALGALTKEVNAMGLIREKLNYPRVMVLIDDYIDGIAQPKHITAVAIEKAFMKNKFPVVSKDQMEKIKEKDATLSYKDPDKAAALGRRYGAEVVIVGQSTSDLLGASQPYGVSVYAYEARNEAKAVKTDNARVLAMDTSSKIARGSGRVPTANEALTLAAWSLSESFMKKIAEAWRNEAYNETSIQIICDNATIEKSGALKEALDGYREVKGVNERSLQNNVLELDVRFFGTSDQLAVFLSELKEPALEISAKTPSRIDIKFKD